VYVPLWKCYSATTSVKPRDFHLQSATKALRRCYRLLQPALILDSELLTSWKLREIWLRPEHAAAARNRRAGRALPAGRETTKTIPRRWPRQDTCAPALPAGRHSPGRWPGPSHANCARGPDAPAAAPPGSRPKPTPGPCRGSSWAALPATYAELRSFSRHHREQSEPNRSPERTMRYQPRAERGTSDALGNAPKK
jgi:hypothetical protein